MNRLRAWWRKRREVQRLRLDYEAKLMMLEALRDFRELQQAVDPGTAVTLAEQVRAAQARLHARKGQP